MDGIEEQWVMTLEPARSAGSQHLVVSRTTFTVSGTIRRLRPSSGSVLVVTSSSRYWVTVRGGQS